MTRYSAWRMMAIQDCISMTAGRRVVKAHFECLLKAGFVMAVHHRAYHTRWWSEQNRCGHHLEAKPISEDSFKQEIEKESMVVSRFS